jgi:hypothetical protein
MRFDVFSINRFVDSVGRENIARVTLSQQDMLELANLALIGAKSLEIARRKGQTTYTSLGSSAKPEFETLKQAEAREVAEVGKDLGLSPKEAK